MTKGIVAMEDLVDKFERLLADYQEAVATYTPDSEGWYALADVAIDLCDFLVEHGPTVTFTEPKEEFDPEANFKWTGYDPATGGSWTRQEREP